MALASAQLTALANDIAANTATVTLNTGVQSAMNTIAHTVDNAYTVAAWYNQPASPAFFGNYASVPLAQVKGAVSWKNLTPADAPDGTTTWTNRSLACQGQQFNLQMLITPAGAQNTLDATQQNVLQGLKDALNSVPSGVGGASQSAGWNAVQKVLCRTGTYAEKLFADTTNGTGADNTHAASFGPFEGAIAAKDVENAWGITG